MWLDKLLRAVHLNAWWAAKSFGMSAPGYCDIEGVDGEHALVTDEGGLVSLLYLGGTRKMVNATNITEVIAILSRQLSAYMSRNAHSLQVVITRDNGMLALDRELSEALNPSLLTAQRVGLEMDDLFRAKAIRLASVCAVERAYLVAFTSPDAVSPADRRAGLAERQRVAKEIPGGPDGLRPLPPITSLREAHTSLVKTLTHDLQHLGYRTRLMRIDEAMRTIRHEVDPDWTAENWQPSYPGDGVNMGRRVRAAEAGQRMEDMSNVYWPSMARQLIPRGAEVLNTRVLQIGSRMYQPVCLSLPPSDPQPFAALFQRLQEARIPYRISFRLTGNGVDDTEIQMRNLVSFFSTSRTSRAALKEAYEDVANGAVRVGLQIDACTWVEDGDQDSLRRATSNLARAFQGWGGCEMDEKLGSPVAPVLATVPGLMRRGVGVLSVPPVTDAVHLLPVTRPTSPWEHGSMLLRTPDGRIYPYQNYSRQQAAWITLIFSPMGGGKSVLLNALNASLCFSAGDTELPFISVLDIGASSFGLVSLIRETLPEGHRHLAQSRKLRMSEEDAINPTDTPLGMRYPLPVHRAYLLNLLTQLVTSPGAERPEPSATDVLVLAIDETYEAFSDEGTSPRRYDRGVCREIDALIEQLDLAIDHRTTWWEIVDLLFDAGAVHGAILAQRHASPLIGEIAAACRRTSVAEQFKDAKASTGELLTDFVYRALTQAIREFPILSKPTQFSFGDARIVALDLSDVAPKGGPAADRQTGIMYLLGRQVLAGRVFLDMDALAVAKALKAGYREWHAREITRMAPAKKAICYDELHRTKASPPVRAQIEQDIREGRKTNVSVTLASQLLGDFSETMVELSTTIFLLGAGQTDRRELLKRFRLGDEVLPILDRIGNPTSDGAAMLAVFETNDGRYVHEVVHTLSAIELWAYNSSAEDRAIRDTLYARLGPQAARHMLAMRYPSGSAGEDIERRRKSMGSRGLLDALSAEDARATVIERIIDEVTDAYERHIAMGEGDVHPELQDALL